MYEPPSEYLLQGDIFRALPVVGPDRGPIGTYVAKPISAIVLASSCEVSKVQGTITLAQIRPIEALDPGLAKLVRRDETAGTWYLPDIPNLAMDGYVDFQTASPFLMDWLGARKTLELGRKEPRARTTPDTPERVASLRAEEREKMIGKYAYFIMRPVSPTLLDRSLNALRRIRGT